MGRFQDFSVVRGAPVVGKGYWQARIIVFEKGKTIYQYDKICTFTH